MSAQVVVGILQWQSPSLVSAKLQNIQSQLLGQIVNCDPESQNIGLVLTPQFCYKKGGLFRLEADLLQKLANANLNLDRGFSIPLCNRSDERDSRPMQYMGKFTLPMAFDADKQPQRYGAGIWSSTALWNKFACEPSPMLKTRDMKTMDVINEEATPTTTDVDTHQNPAEKFFQLGEVTMHKFLHSILTGLKTDGKRKGVIIVDLFSHSTDLARAFVELLPTLPSSSFYYRGFTSCDDEKEWADDLVQRHIRDAFLQGKCNIPGHNPMPAEMPSEMLEDAPTKPTLHAMAWGEGIHLKLPDHVLRKWHDHNRFGDRFQDWYKSTEAQHALGKAEEDTQTPRKRTGNGDNTTTPPPKKAKTDGDGKEETPGLQALKQKSKLPSNQKSKLPSKQKSKLPSKQKSNLSLKHMFCILLSLCSCVYHSYTSVVFTSWLSLSS